MNLYRLWTLKPIEVWDNYKATGVLQGDGRRVWRSFLPSYRWIMEQMKKRLPEYTGRFPVWTWYQPKPDLRGSGHFNRGTKAVRIECIVPKSRVLPSDFDAWHCVLNQGYLYLTDEEEQFWESRLPDPFCRYENLSPDIQAEMRLSWERIFDLELMIKSDWWTSDKQHLQAVIEKIYLIFLHTTI